MALQGIDISLITTIVKSSRLSDEYVGEIIERKYKEAQKELEDKKIKPRTIIGSVVGGIIASIIGGTLWGVQMIYSGRIFYIFLIGLVLLCYGLIKLLTRQTKQNIAVIIATIIATLLALLIGQFLYNTFGHSHYY